MANIIFGGGASYGGGSAFDVPASPPIQASTGTVTAITIQVNRAIQSFYPFASVQYGVSPYTYSVSSGTLPTGITLDTTTGLVSGTPTVIQATGSVTFSVTDSTGVTSSTTSTTAFTINAAITATANSVAPVQTVQNGTITNIAPFASVTGGTLPYYYFVSSGQLPDRVTLDPTTGLVSGTPTELYSTANVTFSVRDGGGIVASTTSTVSFTVRAPVTATLGTSTPVSAIQGSAITNFNPFAGVSGGYTPYTYYVSSGTLPTGITINSSTGQVSGTPSAVYSLANVVFSVQDSLNNQANITVTVNFIVIGSYTINYLVVAGGGAGSASARGGGGSGGGGGVLATTTRLVTAPGTSYSITIGCGGTGAAANPSGQRCGTPGTPSTITGPGITTITAVGGGRGGSSFGPGTPTVCIAGAPGGSGGGGTGCPGGGAAFGYPSPAPLFYTPTGAQGYPGTGGVNSLGVGGGAGGNPGATPAPGYTWTFNGGSYAQGGAPPAPPGQPGGTNTGKGGGGSSLGGSGAGGPGIVAIAYASPTQLFVGGTITPGAANPAAPGYYVHTFTSPGTLSINSITATAGTTVNVSATQNIAITSFNPFASVTKGFAPYTYFVSSGTLPPGIALDSSTGQVSGTPTTVQSSANVIFAVKDSQNNQAVTTVTVSFIVGVYAINYLVVAGGGYGASNSCLTQAAGGGGAGGLLRSSSTLFPNTTYNIQVGAGQSKSWSGTVIPGAGLSYSSNISGSGFATVTTCGGGSGGAAPSGFPGGSGGGTGAPGGPTVGFGTAIGSPGVLGVAGPQGYPGRGVFFTPPFPAACNTGGPGGGAGGACGCGLVWPYNGLTYAKGGRGIQGKRCCFSSGAGNIGTGNGGNATSSNASDRQAGGPGTVIITVPNAAYPITVAPGAAVSTPPAAPGYTVLTYTAPDPLYPASYSLIINPNTNSYTVQYLVVGGGGSAGYLKAGGGGGGGMLCGTTFLSAGTCYIIQVGGGGDSVTTGAPGCGVSGNPGKSSNITSPNPNFVTITTLGGGGGGGASNQPTTPISGGLPGGSGGGGAWPLGPLIPTARGAGTFKQGFNGGLGAFFNGPGPGPGATIGGGGGGASQAGAGDSFIVCSPFHGHGGNGRSWLYNGLFYAGGGGGYSNARPVTDGGQGGGGNGGNISSYPGTPGTGGGGGGSNVVVSASGGSGTVILAIPTPVYPTISAPGAAVSTPPAAPGLTVLTYTTPTPTNPATFTFTA